MTTNDKIMMHLTKIAQTHLGVDTLVTRKSDSLDFYDLAVWNIASALQAAYEVGASEARRQR